MEEDAVTPLAPNSPFIASLVMDVKAGEVAVFCGAGISFHSGMPLARDLVEQILGALSCTRDDIDIIVASALPFESFMETLGNGGDISPLLDIFADGSPASAHMLIAQLARKRYLNTICTTNFDALLERAFDASGLQRDREYVVLHREDDFSSLQTRSEPIRLIKVHGSAHDPETMAITLRQVSSRLLSTRRQAALDHVFSTGAHRRVLILGYSCSDIFDISPHLERIEGERKSVTLVDHSANEDSLASIQARQTRNPFRRFPNSEWLRYDTDMLLAAIWTSCLSEPYVPPRLVLDARSWKERIDRWSSSTPALNKLYVTGQLFMKVSKFEKAIEFFSRALPLLEESPPAEKARLLSALATCWLNVDEYQQAVRIANEALVLSRQSGEVEAEAGALHALGTALGETGDHRASRQYLEHVRHLAATVGNKQLELVSLANLGRANVLLGDYGAAIETLESTVQVAQVLGDKHAEVRAVAGLGGAHYWRGDHDTALSLSRASLQMAVETADTLGEAVALNNLALVYIGRGDYHAALDSATRVRTISRQFGYRRLERTALEHLGHISLAQGEIRAAEDYYQESLSISRKIGDRAGEGMALGNIGRVFHEYENLRLAHEYYQQALTIARDLGDRQGQATWLGNIGLVLIAERRDTSAGEKLEEALSFAREIGDRENECRWIGQIGLLECSRREYRTALGHFDHAVRCARMCGNNGTVGTWLTHMGDAYRALGEAASAAGCYRDALKAMTTVLDPEHPNVKRVKGKIGQLET